MYRYLIASALLLFISSSLLFAQSTVTQKQWNEVESQLNSKIWVKDPKEILLQWKANAIKNGDDVDLARSLNNLLKIRDKRTEDSLYFYNSAFIDTLLTSPKSSARLKAIMHVMQAQRLNGFTRHNRKFSRATYLTPKLKFNYAALSDSQIDSLSLVHLQLALQQPAFKYDIKEYRWLSSGSGMFLFEPRFNDLVHAEHVSFGTRLNYYYRDTIYSWLRLSSAQFRGKLAAIGEHSNDRETLYAYHQWIKYNEKDAGIAAFIESLARKEIWMKASSDTTLRPAYINYLQDCISTPYPQLKAHAIYQLCLIWNEDGKRYANFDPYRYYYNGSSTHVFNKKYQYYPLMALRLYEENAAFMKNYPTFDGVLRLMARQIRSGGVQLKINADHVIPGTPIALTATYRNADTLYYRIIRTGAEDSKNEQGASVMQSLLKHAVVSQGKFALPATKDYNVHATYLKLDGLAKGSYRLLFATRPLNIAEVKKVSSLAFGVGNLAVINTDERVFVLDRASGKPISGAKIKAYYTDHKNYFNNEVLITTPINPSNKQGYTIVPENTTKLIVSYNGDTTITNTRVNKNEFSGDVYEKDEDDDDDDLLDYYDEKLRISIFTDRSIYRPGQTVYYKAIFMSKDPDTGMPMLFTAGNLKKGQKMMKQWLDDNKKFLMLKDVFNKEIDSAKISINEFGSFAGSFVIPKTAATGEWSIESDGIREEYANRGTFKVEEYKRPTLELVLEKPKKIIKPGQVFSVQLKLRSFSGAPMGNIPVKYTLIRTGRLPFAKNEYPELKMADTTGYTDANGVVNVVINDSLLRKYNLPDSLAWSYTYRIKAESTDPTGETVKVNESVQANSWPVGINITFGDLYDKKDLRAFNVKTSAIYEGVVGREVKIKLYSTNKTVPGEYINNTIERADQWLYSKDSLNKWFPGLLAEATPALKKELVWETVVNTTKFETLTLPSHKIKAGTYEVIATTTDSGRLSGQSTYSFKIFDSATGSVPESKTSLSYLTLNSVKPGEKVTWYTWAGNNTYSIYQAKYVKGLKLPQILTSYTLVNEQ